MASLTWADIAAWCDVRRIALSDFERRALIEINDWRVYWTNLSVKQKQDAEEAKRKAETNKTR